MRTCRGQWATPAACRLAKPQESLMASTATSHPDTTQSRPGTLGWRREPPARLLVAVGTHHPPPPFPLGRRMPPTHHTIPIWRVQGSAQRGTPTTLPEDFQGTRKSVRYCFVIHRQQKRSFAHPFRISVCETAGGVDRSCLGQPAQNLLGGHCAEDVSNNLRRGEVIRGRVQKAGLELQGGLLAEEFSTTKDIRSSRARHELHQCNPRCAGCRASLPSTSTVAAAAAAAAVPAAVPGSGVPAPRCLTKVLMLAHVLRIHTHNPTPWL